MKFSDLVSLYGRLPQAGALLNTLGKAKVHRLAVEGLVGSSVPLLFSSIAGRLNRTVLFILDDADEAGYFFNDLKSDKACFFPSAYRRAVKYGQRDDANEILRTETLAAVSSKTGPLFIVTCPEAVAELVVSQNHFDEQRISLKTSQTIDITDLEHRLRDLGFDEVDYVYEPGQFAVRGSIVDIYSYSSELPYRIDFFGDEIDTIRTFSVEDQLSQDRRSQVEIVPELAVTESEKVPFLRFLPEDTLIVMKDERFVLDNIQRIYNEGFSSQAMTERLEGATEVEQEQIRRDMNREAVLCKPTVFNDELARFQQIELSASSHAQETPDATITFHTKPQPLFHKNFDLLKQSLEDYQLQGYKIYILADSEKQQQRLKDILNDMSADEVTDKLGDHLIAVDKTVHEGFVDDDLKACLFTDHQIFDRFHKYNLKSDKARSGKMALTMKELQQMEPGDYLVHVDFGIGKFGGLIKVPNPQGGYQEVIRIIYQNNDKVDVSIHSLYKISKYRAADTGEPPRLYPRYGSLGPTQGAHEEEDQGHCA